MTISKIEKMLLHSVAGTIIGDSAWLCLIPGVIVCNDTLSQGLDEIGLVIQPPFWKWWWSQEVLAMERL